MSQAEKHLVGRQRGYGVLILVLAFVYGVLVRVVSAREPLWLDEVLALRWIEVLPNFGAIFTGYFSENNHFLQSAWLWLVRDVTSGYAKRGFSLVCALSLLAALFVSALQAAGWRRFLFLLCSSSYFIILYGTEARGYSPLLLGMYLTFEVGERLIITYSLRNIALFWFTSLFAILSHVSAFSFLGALLLGLWGKIGFLKSAVLGLPSVCSLFFLWFFFLSRLTEAGGDIGNELNAVLDLFSIGIGGPEVSGTLAGIWGLLIALAGILWLPKVLFRYVRERKDNWIFFISGIFLLPIFSWFGYGPEYTYPRHFLPALFIVFFFLSRLLDDAFRAGGGKRLIAMCFVVLFTVGNTLHAVSLVRYGRGDYRLVRESLERDPAPIAFDHAYRHQTMLNFYHRRDAASLFRLPIEEQPPFPDWARLPDWPKDQPVPRFAWFLSQGPAGHIPRPFEKGDLVLRNIITSAPLSGWSTYIYQIPGETLSAKSSAIRKWESQQD